VPLGRGRDLGGLASKEALQPSDESLLLGGGLLRGWPLLALRVVARVARLTCLARIARLASLAGIAGIAWLAAVTPE
jgi:hypothetical protein